MFESGKTQFIHKKSYEVAYALWQLAAHIKEESLADRFRDKAIELVGYAANADYSGMAKVAEGMQMLTKFAVDVNAISIGNAAILTKETGNLQAAIEIPKENSEIGGIDISKIFSADILGDIKEDNIEEDPPVEIWLDENFAAIEKGNGNSDHIGNENESGGESGNESNSKAETRQAAILERIRQIGNCRLGDLQAILPDISERTIRYDLESLVRNGLIERMGIGGRSVYYRLKQG